MTNITQTERQGKRVGLRCAVVLALGLAGLIAAGNFGCKASSSSKRAAGKDSRSPQIKGVLHLEPFVVNLADTEDNRFLRIGMDLGLGIPISSKDSKGGEGPVPTARTRDCILTVLCTWNSDALLAPEGKQKLKDELVHALQGRVPELNVKEVYFTDFLVQR